MKTKRNPAIKMDLLTAATLTQNNILTVRDAFERIERSPVNGEKWFLLTIVLREMALAQKFDLDRKITMPTFEE